MAIIQETPVLPPIAVREDAFFYRESNRKVVNGNPNRDVFHISKNDSAPSLKMMGIGLMAALAIFIVIINSELWCLALVLGIGGVIFLASTEDYSDSQKLMQRYTREGQILQGELLAWVASVGQHPFARGPADFDVTVEYRFTTPDYITIHRTTKEVRNDLNGKQLPMPGTPVYVLYFNDREYYLL
jgi:hypothetical protein